jgi:hypothetical protein
VVGSRRPRGTGGEASAAAVGASIVMKRRQFGVEVHATLSSIVAEVEQLMNAYGHDRRAPPQVALHTIRADLQCGIATLLASAVAAGFDVARGSLDAYPLLA